MGRRRVPRDPTKPARLDAVERQYQLAFLHVCQLDIAFYDYAFLEQESAHHTRETAAGAGRRDPRAVSLESDVPDGGLEHEAVGCVGEDVDVRV